MPRTGRPHPHSTGPQSATEAAQQASFPSQSSPQPFPDTVLNRYEHLLDRTEDASSAPNERGNALGAIRTMEIKHPGIQLAYIKMVAQREATAARQSVSQTARRHVPYLDPSRPSEGNRYETPTEKVLRRAANWGMEALAVLAEREAVNVIDRFIQAGELSLMSPRTPEIDSEFDDSEDDDDGDPTDIDFSTGDLTDHLNDWGELEVEVLEDDDDAGNDYHEIKLTIPSVLLAQCGASNKGARKFMDWMLAEDDEG